MSAYVPDVAARLLQEEFN